MARVPLVLSLAAAFAAAAAVALPANSAAQAGDTGVVAGAIIEQGRNLGVSSAVITLSGHVDANGELVAVLAGNDGRFVISGVPVGTHTLQARQSGYVTLTLPEVKVVAGDTTNLALSMSSSVPSVADARILLGNPAGGPQPMFIVDGLVLSSSRAIEELVASGNIESIEVIKGAAAASMYGTRAENGVISIRLKKRVP